jgi:hypothetical protein
MSWTTPSWYALALLTLAAYRSWLLLAVDEVGAPFRRLMTGISSRWVDCPWCSGFWIGVAWWLAWEAWPRWTLVAATALAVSVGIGLLARL